MPRKNLHFAAVFAACLFALPASLAAQDIPPTDHGFISGINLPEISGAPFSATAVIEMQRYMPDDTTQVRRTINLIARDSSGRTHNETRRLMPEYFHGSPLLLGVRIFDPITRIRTIYGPADHIARRQVVPQQPETNSIVNPALHVQDLGSSTLNGLPTKGTRRTYTISAKVSGTGDPVLIEDEEWYSEDLHISLLTRHYDPRYGILTVGVSSLKREEPPASMFREPPGYKTLDVAPPTAAPSTPPGGDPLAESKP